MTWRDSKRFQVQHRTSLSEIGYWFTVLKNILFSVSVRCLCEDHFNIFWRSKENPIVVYVYFILDERDVLLYLCPWSIVYLDVSDIFHVLISWRFCGSCLISFVTHIKQIKYIYIYENDNTLLLRCFVEKLLTTVTLFHLKTIMIFVSELLILMCLNLCISASGFMPSSTYYDAQWLFLLEINWFQ